MEPAGPLKENDLSILGKPHVSPNKTGSDIVVPGINRPQLGLLKSAIRRRNCEKNAAWLLPVMVGYWDCLLLDFPQKHIHSELLK